MKKIFIISSIVALMGCTTTGRIAPQYINPAKYQQHDCTILQNEITRVANTASATEKQNISLSATGVGIGIAGGRHGIYPTISVGAGIGNARQEKNNTLAKLYGEHDAMVIAARQKGCSFAHGIKIYGE